MERTRLSRRNSVAKDLRTPKYRMRVVSSEKIYDRAKMKNALMRELKSGS